MYKIIITIILLLLNLGVIIYEINSIDKINLEPHTYVSNEVSYYYDLDNQSKIYCREANSGDIKECQIPRE